MGLEEEESLVLALNEIPARWNSQEVTRTRTERNKSQMRSGWVQLAMPEGWEEMLFVEDVSSKIDLKEF